MIDRNLFENMDLLSITIIHYKVNIGFNAK